MIVIVVKGGRIIDVFSKDKDLRKYVNEKGGILIADADVQDDDSSLPSLGNLSVECALVEVSRPMVCLDSLEKYMGKQQ